MRSLLLPLTALLLTYPLLLAEKPATADPKAHAIIDKFIEASGGKEAFEKIKTRVAEGSMSMEAQGINISIKLSQKAPNMVHMEQEIKGLMKGQQGYDGKKGWAEDSLLGFRELEGAELEQIKRESNIRRELNLKTDYPTMKLLPEEKDGDKTLSVIEATTKDDRTETWYFDQSSGLMVKMKQKMSMGPQGELDVTITLEDYKEVDGIKIPMTSNVSNPAFTGVLKMTSVKHNVDVDDILFAGPKKASD